ncbi:MAG: hypothetical protein KF812_08160, partial [Fimbriimonadaceae bacterium]|nr:hypothetical protein [Fimbriimonadaceae bacterium]
ADGSGHANIWLMNQSELVLEILSSRTSNSRCMVIFDTNNGALISFRYSDDFGQWRRRLQDEPAAVAKFLNGVPLPAGSYEPLEIGSRPDEPATWNYARILDGWMVGKSDGISIFVKPGLNVVLQANVVRAQPMATFEPAPLQDLSRARTMIMRALLPNIDFPGWYRIYPRHFALIPLLTRRNESLIPSWYGLATRQDADQIIQHAEYVQLDPKTGELLRANGCPEVLGRTAPPQVRNWGGEMWRFRSVDGAIFPSSATAQGPSIRLQVWRTLEVVVADYFPDSDLIVAEGVAGRPSPVLSRAFLAAQFGP